MVFLILDTFGQWIGSAILFFIWFAFGFGMCSIVVAIEGWPWYVGFLFVGTVIIGGIAAYALVFIVDLVAWVVGRR